MKRIRRRIYYIEQLKLVDGKIRSVTNADGSLFSGVSSCLDTHPRSTYTMTTRSPFGTAAKPSVLTVAAVSRQNKMPTSKKAGLRV